MKPQERTRAILRSRLDAESRLVAVAIADHMDVHGGAYPGVGTLAEETALSERTVRAVIAHGERSGWLLLERRVGGSTVYRLAWERLSDAAVRRPSGARKSADPCTGRRGARGAGVHGAQGGGARGAGGGVHGAHHGGARGAPEACPYEPTTEAPTRSHPASAACAAPPPAAVEQPPLLPPTPEPDPVPAPPAKPARASTAKPPRAEKAATPGYREAIDRWDRAYREAHGDTAYPYVFTGRDSDAGHVRTVLAAARYTEADAAGALDRIETAARAYMASAALGQTYPRGEPVTLRWFARDVARWLRTDPREILTPDFSSPRRPSAQQEKADTLDWIAAARAKLAAQK